jgi:hypothetical protein
MSSFAKRGLGSLSFAVVGAVLLASGCTATPKGSLMLAISTDMQTPKDISVVSIFIAEGSTVKFDYVGRVLPDGTVSLPSTLALVEPDDPSTQIQIRVIAFNEQNPRVLRDVQTTVPHARTALLRLPLNFLDLGSVTGQLPAQFYPTTADGVAEGISTFDPTDPTSIVSTCDPMHLCQTPGASCQTMINGVCTTATVVSSTLPVYTPTEVYGDGGVMANGAPESCFPVQRCFAEPTAVNGVGPGMCSFTLPSAGQPMGQPTDAGPAAPNSAGQPMDAGPAPAADAATVAPTVDASTSGCVPKRCADLGYNCGQAGDECGGLLSCGTCTAPQFCGGGGPSVCGGNSGGVPDGGVSAQSATISLTAPNINVALVTQSTGACLAPGQCYVPLPDDPVEGWTLQGNTVTLAPGPCMKLGSTVTLAVSGACATDTISEPVCEPTTAAEVAEAGAAPIADASPAGGDAGAPRTDANAPGCDGNYVVTCFASSACNSTGGTAALTVSGAQGTLYAPMNGDQIVPIAGSVDTATCVTTITLPGSEGGSCDNPGGVVVAALTSGASFTVPCSTGETDGSCVQATQTCTVAMGTLDASTGAPLDSGSGGSGCAGPMTLCGNLCTNTLNDPDNCGTCGNACQTAALCTQGTCACGEGLAMCNGACVNELVDPSNCGGCGIICGGGPCVDAQCGKGAPNDGGATMECTGGMSLCGGVCIDTTSSPVNCGGCGVACGGTCTNSRCLVQLASGQGFPMGLAVDSTNVYFSGFQVPGILSVPIAGGAPVTIDPLATETALALDAVNLYWVDSDDGWLNGIPLSGLPDGGSPMEFFSSTNSGGYPIGNLAGLALDSSNAYWTYNDSVLGPLLVKAPLGGGSLTTLATVFPGAVAVDATNVYVWSNGSLVSVPIGGLPDGGAPNIMVANAGNGGTLINEIAVDAANIYWSGPAGVMSAPLAGGPSVTLAADPNAQGPLATDCPRPPGACKATWVYWSGGPCTSPDGGDECVAGSILKVAAGGGAVVTLAPSAGGADIVTDSTSVYFTEYSNQAVMKITPR